VTEPDPWPARGRYIVLEGGEGVGKSTQAVALRERLAAAGIEAVAVREPGGDPFAEAGRTLLLGDLPREPETEVLLFNALRAQVLISLVTPALRRGAWVVSDRNRLSTIAYQGYGHGLDLDWTRSVCTAASGLCPPDLELVLHVDEATATARRSARGVTDRFERLDADFHRRVIDGYLAEAQRTGLPVIDATRPVDEVSDRIWAEVSVLVPARPS
jgi:dTMP kinase